MSLALGRLDHRERNPILDRAAWILIFQFQEKVTRPGVDLRDLHQRRFADQRKDRGWLVVGNRWRWRSLDHSKKLFDLWLACVRPLGLAVFKKLLERWKADFAVVQRITEISTFVDPGCWNPRNRHTGELFDVIFATWTGIGQNREVRLIGELKLREHGTAILASVPDRNEIKMHLWIFFHYFEPTAAFQFSLAIRAPGCPEMHHTQAGRLHRVE